MTTFRFSLQKVLEWRQTQLELAEVLVQQQLGTLAQLDQARLELQAMGKKAESEVRALPCLMGGDLRALGSFRLAVKSQDQNLLDRRAECQKELAVRQAAMLEARRRCRLLERLKERRRSEWQLASDKELEELASDSYLAQWARHHSSL